MALYENVLVAPPLLRRFREAGTGGCQLDRTSVYEVGWMMMLEYPCKIWLVAAESGRHDDDYMKWNVCWCSTEQMARERVAKLNAEEQVVADWWAGWVKENPHPLREREELAEYNKRVETWNVARAEAVRQYSATNPNFTYHVAHFYWNGRIERTNYDVEEVEALS